MPKSKARQEIKRQVRLVGIRPIMFDRYAGDNKTKLAPEQQLYLSPDSTVVLPAANVMSFLGAQNTESACKRFAGKGWRAAAAAVTSFVMIDPDPIPLLRNGKPLKFAGFDRDGFYIHRAVARLPKGIPNPKERPVVSLPWEMQFALQLTANSDVDEAFVMRLFEQGGISIGFGTYRGVYGKFQVVEWS